MAELILTEEDKAASSYLEWDDASLGKAVKQLATTIRDKHGSDALAFTACATMLACGSVGKNGGMKVKLEGVTENGMNYGDWEVTVRQLPGSVGE